MKLKPIRRRYRKTGRNEPCPCGRTKELPMSQDTIIIEGDGPLPPRRVSVKYKHCCGNIDNQ